MIRGTTYKRKDGRWECRVSLGSESGHKNIAPSMERPRKKRSLHTFSSLRKLGKANIYGFVLEEIWNNLTEYDYSIRPDFMEMILTLFLMLTKRLAEINSK